MKILFAIDSLSMGGAEKSTLDILRNFSKDTEAKVVHFYPGFDLKAAYESAGISLHYVGLAGKRSFIKGISSMIRLIKEEKPDLIVSSIMRADLISRTAGLLTGITTIGTFVSDTYGLTRIEELRSQKLYGKFRFVWAINKLTARIPAYYIANAISIAVSNKKALGIREKKIKVIYRGRNTGLFPEWKPPLLNQIFRFVFIGRLLESKGLKELLIAISIVKKNHKDIHLDIFGEGGFRIQMEQQIKELHLQETVTLHGSVPDGWKKLYDANCFVFPSWYEGFSGSLVEAMTSGIPVIASDIPMNLEAINDKMALVFQVKNVHELASKLEKMINEYPQMINLGKQARIHAIKHFDIKVIAHEYESFLKAVVNKTVNPVELI